ARVQEPDHARDARDPYHPRRDGRSGRTVRREGGRPRSAPADHSRDRERRPRCGGRQDRRDPDLPGDGDQGARARAARATRARWTGAVAALPIPRAAVDRVGIWRAGRGHHREAVRVMMRLPPFTYLAPPSAAAAVTLMADHGPNAMLVAGGTDLYPNMKRRQF